MIKSQQVTQLMRERIFEIGLVASIRRREWLANLDKLVVDCVHLDVGINYQSVAGIALFVDIGHGRHRCCGCVVTDLHRTRCRRTTELAAGAKDDDGQVIFVGKFLGSGCGQIVELQKGVSGSRHPACDRLLHDPLDLWTRHIRDIVPVGLNEDAALFPVHRQTAVLGA